MSKSLIAGFPGGVPSKATQARSGEKLGRFAFCRFRRIRCLREPSGRTAQIVGHGDSLQ
jgi:hypothetical protein